MQNQNRYRLVVVDDHALFRRGLIGLLGDMPDFSVVGEAGDGIEALQLIEKAQPDIILMDVNMPSMDGITVVKTLRSQKNPVHILMLTISQDDGDLLQAIKAGANGYILKNTEPEDLRQALLSVAQGQGALSPEVIGSVMSALSHATLTPPTETLSDRELEVLECLAQGLTTLQISAKLFISDNTVKTHIRHILEKLEASNRTEAVGKAIQLGMIHKGN